MLKRGEARVAQRAQRRQVADVGRMTQRPPAARLDFSRHAVHDVAPPAGHDDVSAGVGQPQGERVTDAGRAANDHRRPSREVEEARGHFAVRFVHLRAARYGGQVRLRARRSGRRCGGRGATT